MARLTNAKREQIASWIRYAHQVAQTYGDELDPKRTFRADNTSARALDRVSRALDNAHYDITGKFIAVYKSEQITQAQKAPERG